VKRVSKAVETIGSMVAAGAHAVGAAADAVENRSPSGATKATGRKAKAG
jgi:hypothetical protein